MSHASRRATGRRRFAGGLCAVGLLAVVVYLNALQGAFVYDDENAITTNPAVLEPSAGALFLRPSWWGTGGPVAIYRPVTTLTFALNHLVHGATPLGYHVVNVLLHGIVSVLVALLVFRLHADARLALMTGLLFAVHPIHTEAVASIVGRAEELAALFALLTVFAYLRALRTDPPRVGWTVAAGLLLLLGVLSKESAVMVLPALVLGQLVLGPQGAGRRSSASARRLFGPLVLAAVVAVAVRFEVLGTMAGRPTRLDNVLASAAWPARLLTATKVVGLYATRLIWPVHLSADYSYRQIALSTSPLEAGVVLGATVLVASLLVAVWGLRHDRILTAAIGFAAITFALVSNYVLVIGTIMAERLLYLPSAGFCLGLAVLFRTAEEGGIAASASRTPRARQRWPAVVFSGVVLALGVLTVRRNRVWASPGAFYEALVADAPESARSHRQLATFLSRSGSYAAALAELRASLRILPDDSLTVYNLANTLAAAGRTSEAIESYRRAIDLDPNNAGAMLNLGNLFSAAGDEPSAEESVRRGLTVAPDSPDLLLNLANSLLRQGRLAEAEATYRSVIERAPRALLGRLNYAALLRATNRNREAADQLRVAVTLAPDAAAVYATLADVLEADGRGAEAPAARLQAQRLAR